MLRRMEAAAAKEAGVRVGIDWSKVDWAKLFESILKVLLVLLPLILESDVKLLRNKLLVGKHTGPDYQAEPNENGKYPSKKYKAGDIVLDRVNLEHKLGSEKFRCLDGPAKGGVKKGVAAEGSVDTLDEMSPDELKQVAEDYNIELTGDEDAEELREKIRSSN